MSHATLVIDGRTELDEDVTPGQKLPPAVLASMIQPGAQNQPYLMYVGYRIADAVKKSQPIHVTVTTGNPETITISHLHALPGGQS